MSKDKNGFTPHDKETAIRVLIKSKGVIERAKGMAKAYDVDLDTASGRAYFERECRAQAEKLIK